MHFSLVDRVIEQSADRIVTLKHISSAEEYLQDHFPGYPVLPGVMMLETMVQAARRLCDVSVPAAAPMVLGQVRALKYGAFVRPGATLRVDVTLHKKNDDGTVDFKGEGTLLEPGATTEPPTAVSGRFLLRPVKVS
jgi:3-hydroxyacyl-[acyl-carrier-protein] dehydratase